MRNTKMNTNWLHRVSEGHYAPYSAEDIGYSGAFDPHLIHGGMFPDRQKLYVRKLIYLYLKVACGDHACHCSDLLRIPRLALETRE